MTTLHATRIRQAKDVNPGATIVDPEGKADYLLVHSLTRTLDGETLLAVYPPGRRTGKRRVVRVKDDDVLFELADEAQRMELLQMLADGYANLDMTPGSTALVIGWEGGWGATLYATERLTGVRVNLVEPEAVEPTEIIVKSASAGSERYVGGEAKAYAEAVAERAAGGAEPLA